jgi:formylglycine-generating enzyme required for sulfatase activity
MSFFPRDFPRHFSRGRGRFLLLLPLLLAGVASAVQMKGLWLFDDSADLGKATVGTNLAIVGTPPIWAASAKYGDATLAGVITTQAGAANRLLAIHNIGANGANATRTADYTLVYDVRCPNGNLRRSFYQTDLTNASDAEYFTRGEPEVVNSLGHPTLNFTSFAMPQEEWLRVVVAVKLGTSFTTYLVKADGTVVSFAHATVLGNDPEYALEPSQVILFGDGDGQNNPLSVGQVAIFDGALTASEVAGLGPPGTTITVPPPVIAEGSARALQALMNGPGVDLVFNDVASSSPSTWEIATAPAHGTAVITASSATQCTVRYTPAADHFGIDSYVVQASNIGGPTTSTVTVYVRDPAASAVPDPVGWWQFDYPTERTLATLGENLGMVGSGFTAVPGIYGGDGAVRVAVGSNYLMTHGIPAGTGGGAKVNEYTLLFDVSYTGNAWKTFFQTNFTNVDDGELFINRSHQLGGAGIGGYSTPQTAENNWYRVVLTVDNGMTRRLYVDGQLWFQGNAGAVDDRYSLPPILRIFADNDGEDGPINVTNLAVWSSPLEAAQVAALGAAGFFINAAQPPSPNYPPVITEGASWSVNVGMATPTQLTFHVTDGDNDAPAWTISNPPAHGSAVITASSATECTVTYTSLNTHAGPDTFTVSVADEKVADAIVVNLNVQNSAPVIAGSESYLLNAVLDDGPHVVTFVATDANANLLSWSISTAPLHGTAQLTASTSGTCQIAYTPDPDFLGADSFVVEVSDGQASDSVSVTVTVSNPQADPVLTIVSAHGTTTPPSGSHTHPAGTPLNPSADDEIGPDTRHLCTGWTLTGDGPAAGTGSSFAMKLTRPSILTWQWRTEHRIVTAVSGSGSVSVATGWHPAGQPLQITATPAPGQHFAGWSGDVAGCVMGGKNIVLPMTRAYGTLTANFAPDEKFTIIALPDTQNYTILDSPTDIFTKQTQWVLDNRETLNIKFLTHVGDLVTSATNSAQWTRATDAMNLLNTQLAYGTCPGNHDLGPDSNDYLARFGPNPTHASSIGRWIDPATHQPYAWYRGSSPRGYSSYQIVRINGRDFMFLHLDHDCPDEDMAWAAAVLTAHPQVLTMITTHNYLAKTGGGGTYGTGTGERGYTSAPNVNIEPKRNKPEDVFNALVKPFNQVYMVICGHMAAIYNLAKTNTKGNVVHEVLCCYQSLPNGGNGFLRIMDFRPAENKIFNSTYSPTLGRYFDPTSAADNQGMFDLHNPYGGEFVLDVDFDGRFNSALTIASAHEAVSPATGPHEIQDGTPIVASAEDRIDGLTRYHPIGWTLTGAQSRSGSGRTATLIPQGDATLTWSWITQYWLDTAAIGNGLVNLQDGWQIAGEKVTIQANPDAGASFLQWSGDVAGCTVNGNEITVPMDRPRGPVTAVFSSATPTFAVTVASDYPTTSPAPADYAYAQDSEVTFSAATFTTGDTRRVCTGYDLTGAIAASGDEPQVTVTVTGDLTVTWHWKTQYLVSANAIGPGTVDATSTWVDAGAPLILTAVPDSGAAFTAWTGDTPAGISNGAVFDIAWVTRPTGLLTANFATGMHTLTIASTAASVTPAVGSLVLPHGSVINFAAATSVSGRSRQIPAGWAITGDQPATGTTAAGSYILNADATLTWAWNQEVFLELVAGFEGTILPPNAAGWKPLGSTVALEARPAPQFHFVRWNGDVPDPSKSHNLALVMSQPRIVAADATPRITTGGTPHWWLDLHGRVTADDYEAADLADADGDGASAREEFLAGMCDLDPSLRFQVLQTSRLDGPSFLLTWSANIDRNYVVSRSSDLTTPFVPIAGPLTGAWPSMSALVPATGNRSFFRVEAVLPAATSLDGDSPAFSPLPLAGSLVREMCRIPAGWFTQGDEHGVQTTKPAHAAWVAGFYIDRFEVTRRDWEMVAAWANAHGYDLPATLKFDVPGNHPAVAVNWYDAVKWCNARSEMEGLVPAYHADTAGVVVFRTGQLELTSAHVNWAGDGYRLPTEAEWERASRGGLEGQPYPWGFADASIRANHWDYAVLIGRAPTGAFPYTQRVGFFDGTQPGGTSSAANAYGLFDMVGNAWEWTWDRMGDYSAEPQVAPRGLDTGESRVLRGGSWWEFVGQTTNSQRLPFPPAGDDVYGMTGFRCITGLRAHEAP